MKNYFDKFRGLEGEVDQTSDELEQSNEVVLEVNDPSEKSVLRRIVEGEDLKVNLKFIREDELAAKRIERRLERLGYTWVSTSGGTPCSITLVPSNASSEFRVKHFVENNYDDLMDPILDTGKVRGSDVYLFMALVQHKSSAISPEEKNYLNCIVSAVNYEQINLLDSLVGEINQYVGDNNLSVGTARFNDDWGTNDFKVSFSDLERDIQKRTELLLDLLTTDPMLGRSDLKNYGYDLVIEACKSNTGRWYGDHRGPLSHYVLLESLPEVFSLPKDFVAKHVRDTPEDKVIAAGIINRAYRIEADREPLEI
jgi:hypothetical protein